MGRLPASLLAGVLFLVACESGNEAIDDPPADRSQAATSETDGSDGRDDGQEQAESGDGRGAALLAEWTGFLPPGPQYPRPGNVFFESHVTAEWNIDGSGRAPAWNERGCLWSHPLPHNAWDRLEALPVTAAVVDGDLGRLEELLQSGADPNEWDAFLWLSPLTAAIAADCLEAVDLLLDAGADANLRIESHHGDATPLHYAVERDQAAIITALLEAGAGVEAPGGVSGEHPLNTAVSSGSLEAMRVLLDAGADPNGHELSSTLASVVSSSVDGSWDMLVDAGVRPGPELFYPAISARRTDSVVFLLQLGLDPHPPVDPPVGGRWERLDTRSPIEYAKSVGAHDIVAILEGGDPTAVLAESASDPVEGRLAVPQPAITSPEVFEQKVLQHEEAIAACMGEQGFAYVVSVPFDARRQQSAAEAIRDGRDPLEVIAAMVADEDPNDAIRARLPATQRRAWDMAYWGSSVPVLEPGCYYSTFEDVWGVDPIEGNERGRDDPRLAKAQQAYSECMAEYGYEVPNSHDFDAFVWERRIDASQSGDNTDGWIETAEAANETCREKTLDVRLYESS